MSTRSFLVLIAALALLAPAAGAVTLHVPAQHATIQGALDAAARGDTVLVAPGLYVEVINLGGKSLVLRSEAGPEATTIRSPATKASTGVIYLPGGSDHTTVIEGFTIDGAGRTDGIHCLQADPLVTHCVIENCLGGFDGGGVWLQHCGARIVGNVIRHNRGFPSGGGVFVRLGTGHEPVQITGNEIYENTAGNGGGIVCIEGAGAVIARNLVHHNHVDPPLTEGIGAVSIVADGCRIVNNTIVENDGGITVARSTDTDVRNNIVVGNARGGLIVNPYAGVPQNLVYAYNDVWGNAAGDYLGTAPGELDISADPLFMVDPEMPPYSLSGDSPCIDAGDPDPIYNDPDGTRSDIGAIPFNHIITVATLHVPGDFPTIQAAIDAADQHDEIIVARGTYREQLDFKGKSLSLIARDGPRHTLLAPPPLGPVKPHDLALATAAGGRPPAPTQPGVLISLPPGSGPMTRIEGFHLDGEGTNEGVHCLHSSPTIVGCEVENCVGSYDGGGLWFEHCAPTVQGCTLHGNRTPISGGGIFIRLGVGFGQARFLDNEIHDNVGGNGGGIVCIEGEGVLIERNRIYDNHVDPPVTEGWGAVTLLAGNALVRNNTICFNDGGITIAMSTNVDLRNNIVTSNLAGGLIVNDYAGPSQLTHDYNDVWDNAGGDYLNLAPAAHELSLDPRFRKPPREHGPVDLSLWRDSPCIDAGDPDPAFNDPDGSRADIGAVPFQKPGGGPALAKGGPAPAGGELAARSHPNPCNPMTTISFSVPAAGPVQLVVYDLRGREIRRLVDGPLAAGGHDVLWDGRTSGGAAAPSGTYFYKLVAGPRSLVGRVTLLK